MAAKSDFAQKLLHDLRIRKERMGVSQSSARDAYRNPGNVQRGSRQTKSLESIGGSKTSNQLQMHGRSPRAPAINKSSQQIVSYAGGGHQRTESMGDFPVAFTYAVKNGGKLLNMDFSASGNANTMIDFLHQIGRRSLDVRNTQNQTSLVKHRPSNGGGSVVVPALTATQIKEISKGVHNLYEIIRSSSNGSNVDRHSIDVGKELLKGAKGLEESLRMLVNLQEASEMIGTPQRKNRVTLMEVDQEDENDGSKIVNQNQVALPRFSFDKPSKRSNSGQSQSQTDGSSMVSSIHRRSTSYGAESIKNISNSSSNSEKGRISNVIAKLMGLEEIPGKIDSQSNTHNESRIKRQPKDGVAVAPLKDQKPQLQSHESDKSGDSVAIKQRSDQLPEKQDRRQNFETKEKIQQKRRIAESSVNLQHERVEKKKAIRVMEKSNEIKLVPRNNVQIREPEKKTQKSKQVIKSKESQMQPNTEQNLKPKDHATRKPERTEGNVKAKVVIRKKVDSLMAVRRTESPQKDDVLKKKNGTRTLKNLISPSKHKLSVLKETQRKDEQQLVPKTNIKRSNSKKLEEKIEVTDSVISQVPKCENTIKIDPEKTLEIEVSIKHVDSSKRIKESTRDLSENKPKKLFQSGIVLLTENEKQLKEILIKDQLFLSMAETLFNFNIPVGFLIVDDHNNHHNDEIKLKLDCGYEIVRRKARRQELLTHPYMKQPSIGGTSIRFLDELVKQLYKDLESLRLYGRNTDNEYDEADYLHYMLERDIFNNNPDINSFWDFGWHTTSFAFVEKDEFVNDVERDLLHGLVDEMVDDLLSMGNLPF